MKAEPPAQASQGAPHFKMKAGESLQWPFLTFSWCCFCAHRLCSLLVAPSHMEGITIYVCCLFVLWDDAGLSSQDHLLGVLTFLVRLYSTMFSTRFSQNPPELAANMFNSCVWLLLYQMGKTDPIPSKSFKPLFSGSQCSLFGKDDKINGSSVYIRNV